MKNLCVFLFTVFYISCNTKSDKYKNQIELTSSILKAISKNDTMFVLNSFGTKNLANIERDTEGIVFDVKRASSLMAHIGIPNQNTFVFKEFLTSDPSLVDVTIPLFQESQSLSEKYYLVIHFAKYYPPDKILDFRIEKE